MANLHRTLRWLGILGLPALAAGYPLSQVSTTTVSGKITTTKVGTKGATSDRDVVVYLVPKTPAKLTPPAKPVTVLQKQLNYEPHVLAIVTGTKVSFRNEDRIKHNIWCKDAGAEIDTDAAACETVDKVYDKAGVKNITCRLHPDMSMYIVVLDTPYFATCAIDKEEVNGEKVYTTSYKIADVPPGEYTLKTWNKKLGAIEQAVTVEAGKPLTLDLDLKK